MSGPVKTGSSFFYYGTIGEMWSMSLRDPVFWSAISIILTMVSLMVPA